MAKNETSREKLLSIAGPDISSSVEAKKLCDLIIIVRKFQILAWTVTIEGLPFDKSHFKEKDGDFTAKFPQFAVEGRLDVAIDGTGALGAVLGARIFADNKEKGDLIAKVKKGISCRAEESYDV